MQGLPGHSRTTASLRQKEEEELQMALAVSASEAAAVAAAMQEPISIEDAEVRSCVSRSAASQICGLGSECCECIDYSSVCCSSRLPLRSCCDQGFMSVSVELARRRLPRHKRSSTLPPRPPPSRRRGARCPCRRGSDPATPRPMPPAPRPPVLPAAGRSPAAQTPTITLCPCASGSCR